MSGIASLLKGYNTSLYADDIEQLIKLSADYNGNTFPYDQRNGFGRVNAQKALQYLKPPYTLQHFTAENGVDNGVVGSGELVIFGAFSGDVRANAAKIEVQKTVNLPYPSCEITKVWGDGRGLTGMNDENGFVYGEGFAEVVPGTQTATQVTLRTYVYEYYDPYFSGWLYYPCTPAQVVFSYSVLSIPAPSNQPSMTGADAVCETSNNYSITNLPAGTTVQWQATPSGIVSINTPNDPQITLTRMSDGTITLTATISASCMPPLTKSVVIGRPAPPTNVVFNGGSVEPSSLCPNTQYSAVVYPTDYTRYEWYMPSGWTSSNANTGPTPWICYDYEFDFQTDASSTGEMAVAKANACGLSDVVHIQTSLDCGGYYYYSISPNPTTSRVTVDGSAKKKNIKEIQLVDNLGNVRKATKYVSNTQRVNLDVSDVTKGNYYLRIYDGKTWVVKQISIH